MIFKKPLAGFVIPVLSLICSPNALGNNVLKIVTGELVGKTNAGILVKTGKTSHEEIGLSAIGSVMVLDGKKLLGGVRGTFSTAGVGGGAGSVLSVADGPRNIRRSLKLTFLGAASGPIFRAGYNFLTRKPPILFFDSNRPGDTLDRIQSVALGARVRVTYKNHH